MANTIDLATYVAKFEADMSGIDEGFGKADISLKDKLGGMINWSKVAVGGAIVAVVAGVGKLIKDGVQATAHLDEQMSKFQATTGATGDEVEEIRKLAQDLYKVNTDSMEDIVATSEAMKQAMGLTTEEIKGSQQAFMDFAKTTNQNNADVVGAIDDIGDAWGLTLDEMVGSLDMFKLSSEKFGTDIASVQKAMQQLAPASKALGMNFEETNGLLNMMAEAGLDASSGVTALNYAAKTVESPEQFQKMLRDIQAIEDPTLRTQKAVELFGARAGVAMSNVLDGSQSLEDFMITMKEAEGTVSKASDAFDSNFNVQLELAKKMFSGLVQELGDKFMPVVSTLLSWITDNMPIIESVITTAFNIMGGVFGYFIDIINFVIDVLKQFVSENQESFNVVKETILTTFDTIMEFLNAFVEVFEEIWDNYGEFIITHMQIVWDTVSGVFEGALDFIKGILDFFIALFKGDWDGMGKAIQQITSGLWRIIESLFKGAIDMITNIMRGAISTLTNIATSIMQGIFNAFQNVWESITSWINNMFYELANTISGFGRRFYNAGRDIFEYMWDGLKSVWSSISRWVSDKVDWLKDKLAFWKKSQKQMESSSSSKSPSVSQNDNIPKYDIGTPFVPNDQLAFLHKGEAVIPAKYNPYNSENRGRYSPQSNNITIKEFLRIDNFNNNSSTDIDTLVDRATNRFVDRLKPLGLFVKII